MTDSTVGIVIPTLGSRPDWLQMAVDSVLSQNVKTKLVIVGANTPHVETFANGLGVRYIEQDGRGLSNAINTGWKSLRELRYFTWLGDDDILAPGSLHNTIGVLDKQPSAKYVYGRTRYIDSAGMTIYVSRPTKIAPWYMKYGQDYVPQPGSLIRTSAIGDELLVDESLSNAMDLDLFLRLSSSGRHSWAYVAQELSAYRIHGGAITQTKGAADESEMVRSRHRSAVTSKLLPYVAPLRIQLERVYVGVQWRLPISKKSRAAGAYCREAIKP